MSQISLARHPILYYRKKWGYHRCKYGELPKGRVVKEINGIKTVFDFDLGKMIKRMYYNAYEIEVIDIMKKHLKPGDVFIDAGANVGYLSAVAAGLVGTSGQVHSFEPMPRYCGYINEIAELNPSYNIIVNNCALGDKNGHTTMYTHKGNIGGSSIVQGLIPEEQQDKTITIDICRLDDYLRQRVVTNVSMIKIDTEGYELPIMTGAIRYLEANRDNLPMIICEVSPHAFSLVNSNIDDFGNMMKELGYEPFCICGRHRIKLEKIRKVYRDVLFKRRIQLPSVTPP